MKIEKLIELNTFARQYAKKEKSGCFAFAADSLEGIDGFSPYGIAF